MTRTSGRLFPNVELARIFHAFRSSRRKEAPYSVAALDSKQLQPANERRSKRQRTAALQELAEGVARNPSRQRLGVRLSSAAFAAFVRTLRSVPSPDASLTSGATEIILDQSQCGRPRRYWDCRYSERH